MLKNYLKIAWRNLYRNKSFSLLNIVGLTIGLSVTALILIWINYELSIDQYHKDKECIYQVYNKYLFEGEIKTWSSVPKIMGPTIKKDYPEIEYSARMGAGSDFIFNWEDKKIVSYGESVDTDFLKIFSFPFIEGDRNTALDNPNSLVITEAFSKKLFGDEPALGKTVKITNTESFNTNIEFFTITGVIKLTHPNKTFNFEYLNSWNYVKQKGWDSNNWQNNNCELYLKLKKEVDYTSFSKKIETLRKDYDNKSPSMQTYLYPFSRTWLHGQFVNGLETGGRIITLRIFGAIAIIILLIACINFMNLSTARSEKRSKEVGIRKVIGADRKLIIAQFLGESTIISFIAGIIAIPVLILELPAFSKLINHELTVRSISFEFGLLFFCITLFTGILAGSYPALFLSKFKPSVVLKGTFTNTNSIITPRKFLVVFQFTCTVILISASIIATQQLQKVQNRDMGYSKDNILLTSINGEIKKNYELIKNELLSSKGIIAVSKTSSPLFVSTGDSWGIGWEGKKTDDKTIFLEFGADNALSKTFGIDITKGRDFNLKDFPTDSTAVILNETALKKMNLKAPIGKTIEHNGTKWHIIGVIKDFITDSPYEKTRPMVIYGAKFNLYFINIKLVKGIQSHKTIDTIKSVFKKYNPNYPFEYWFMDEEAKFYLKNPKRVNQILGLFTLILILISCLGLFGLASFMTENRTKEIGVRKVLGSSTKSVTTLLTKGFLKLVLISIIIATPVTWYFMNLWLERFDYRISISWFVFVLSGGLALLLAFCTVAYQSIKAASINPIKSLKTE